MTVKRKITAVFALKTQKTAVKIKKFYSERRKTGTMYLYLLCSFVAVIYVLIKKKSVDRKNAIILLLLMIIAVGVYVAQKIFHIE